MSTLIRGLVLASLILRIDGVAGSPARRAETLGNLTYSVPAAWKSEMRGKVAILRPTDAQPSRICTLTIASGLTSQGDMASWIDRQWQPNVGTRKEIERIPIPVQKDDTGFEAGGLSVVLQIGNTPKHYHVFMGFRKGSSAGTFHFHTDSEEYLTKYRDSVMVIAGSIKIAGEGPQAPSTPSVSKPGTSGSVTGAGGAGGIGTSSNPSAPSPGARASDLTIFAQKSGDVELVESMPGPAPNPSGDISAAAALLAKDIRAGGLKGLSAFHRALLRCGISVHDLQRKVIVLPEKQDDIGLSALDFDLVGIDALIRKNYHWPTTSLDHVLSKLPGCKAFELSRRLQDTVQSDLRGTHTGRKFWAHLVNSLSTPAPASSPRMLNSAQMYLLLLRGTGEFAVRAKPSVFLASTSLVAALRQTPTHDAVRNVVQATEALVRANQRGGTDVDWAEWVDRARESAFREGQEWVEPSAYLLAMTRMLALQRCIHVETTHREDPLVRMKEYMAKGTEGTLGVHASFRVEPSYRRSFEQAAALLGSQISLPPDGPLDAVPVMRSDLSDKLQIIPSDPPVPPYTQIDKGFYSLSYQGAPQMQKLGPNPQPVRLWPLIALQVLVTYSDSRAEGPVMFATPLAPESPVLLTQVPVQDWRDPGWKGEISFRVWGSGGFSQGEQSARFSIERQVTMFVELSSEVPTRMISGGIGSGLSILSRKPVLLRVESYDDSLESVTYSGPTCGPEDRQALGQLTRYRRTVKARPPKNNAEASGFAVNSAAVEVDHAAGKYSVRAFKAVPSVPVTQTTRSGNKPPESKDVMASLLADVVLLENNMDRVATVLDQPLPTTANAPPTITGGGSLNAKYTRVQFGDRRTGRYVQQNAPVSIMVNWWFDMGPTSGGQNALESTLAQASDRLSLSLALRREIASLLASSGIGGEAQGPLSDEAADLATCSPTNAALSGTLRHSSVEMARPRTRTRP